MLDRMTKFLVLGIAIISTSAGAIDGAEGDVSAAKADQQKLELIVQANTEFAFDLYREINKESRDGNLFFSPYSISQILAMTLDGARGNTAKEIGEVLRLPAHFERVDNDPSVLPWKMSLIHSGYSELNGRLSAAQDDPNYQAMRSELKVLEKSSLELGEEIRAQEAAKHKFVPWGTPPPKKVKYDAGMLKRYYLQRRAIKEKLKRLEASIPPCEVQLANAIWADTSFPLNQEYIEKIAEHYKSGGIFSVDFRNNFAEARQRINKWCTEKTNNRIQDLLPRLPRAQARALRIALMNAIYFKADWETKFDVGQTESRAFTLANGRKVMTPTMHGDNFAVRYAAFNEDGSVFPTPKVIKFGQTEGLYPSENGFSIVELSYRGEEFSMLVIVPNHHAGLKSIEKKLTTNNWSDWGQQLKERDVNIALPKFKQESTQDLKTTLENLGMKQAFSSYADFRGLCDNVSDSFYLALVRHKAFIEVNETSTEAAASTFAGGLFGAPAESPFIPDFRADRPFIYVIRDVVSGNILFIGKMTNP